MSWQDIIKEKNMELNKYTVTVPYVLYLSYGPIEASDEGDAVQTWKHNTRGYPKLGRGDMGSPIYQYNSADWEPEAQQIIKSEKEKVLKGVYSSKEAIKLLEQSITQIKKDNWGVAIMQIEQVISFLGE